MGYKTAAAALATPTFFGQLFVTVLINLGANFGLPWLTYSNWGARKEYASYPSPPVWAWSYEVNSNIALDVMLSHILIGLLLTWAGSGGAQKDVKLKKLDVLEPNVLRRLPWSLTPAIVPGIFWRGIAMAIYLPMVAGWPMLLLIWAIVGNGTAPGWPYILWKGMWITFVVVPVVFVIVFLSAISRSSFPELDYDLLEVHGHTMAEDVHGLGAPVSRSHSGMDAMESAVK